MLPRAHRLTASAEFETVVRHGSRTGSRCLVVHLQRRPGGSVARAGLVVSRAVGSAVVRNKAKRRLRGLLRDRLALLAGCDVVVRALPAAGGASYEELAADLDRCLRRALERGAGRSTGDDANAKSVTAG